MTRARGAASRRVTVVGGAGAMGRITVRDLVETAPADVEIVLADRDVTAARRVSAAHQRRVRIFEVDARDAASLKRATAGSAVIINACHHTLNVAVMEAARANGSHYCDLGGLFHVTREQLRRHAEFRRAGLIALCGIGSAPGIVNVMARAGVDRLETVDEVHIAVGTVDRTPRRGGSPLPTSYTIDTVLDEASQPAALFTGGRLRFVEPLGLPQAVRFPPPVGLQHPACTIHSELATLPAAFRPKGVREVSFRIAFPGDLADRLRVVNLLGLASRAPVRVAGRPVVPRDLLRALLARAAKPKIVGPLDEYEVLRVTLRGRRRGSAVEDVIDCHVRGMPEWGIGVDIDTGAPPSIAAQMILSGKITARGVLAPESAVPALPFFRELASRGMRIVRRSRHA